MWVKIEGTTSEEDALLAVALGADALGFVFAPSPRQVPLSVAGDIVKRLPPEIITIGVFVDETPEKVVRTVHQIGLKGAQLHGAEKPDQVRWIAERIGVTFKAFPAGHPAVAQAAEYGVDAVIIDSPSPGSGKLFDWSLADGVPTGTRLIMAGGLTPENVGDAIARVRPWGVDVATGVESEPGRKDPRKLRAFIANARAASVDTSIAGGEDDDGPYDWQDDE